LIVDIIVAVYRDTALTRRCIESVLNAEQRTAYELVVIDDACGEPSLEVMLHEYARQGRLTLLEQSEHAGFTAAVNRGLALHPDRDAVILHGDAEVANDWLDRLAAHAAGASDIATIAPFVSYGGVAGYPRSGERNAIHDRHTVGSLDALFRRANAGASLSVPLTCGPCIYVRRDCLALVGMLDAGSLGGDYGVDQAFCLRASHAGFRHLLAADVYVAHAGETAIDGTDLEELSLRARSALDELYPEYRVPRAEFSRRDPVRPYQRRVDLLRLAESSQQIILFVAHSWGGGIRRHIDELTALLGGRCEVLLLEPSRGNTVKLSWHKSTEGFVSYFTLPDDNAVLASLLREIGVARMHYHHVHGLPRAILDLPADIGIPYDCTLHDYYAICPQYHLVTEDGRYCGEPDAAGCAACLSRRPGQWGLDITEWRTTFGRFLDGAQRIIAPSRDVALRIARYFPKISPIVIAHAEPIPTPPRRMARVVTLGNLSPEKGLRVVAACAQDARDRDLRIAYRVLGSTTEPIGEWTDVQISIHGQYAEEQLAALLDAERPDVIWFPAQVPETYSYTLSVALATRLPIVASALGAFPERLAGRPRSSLVPWDASPAQWNAALQAAASGETTFDSAPLVAIS